MKNPGGMTRIAITQAALDAICSTFPEGVTPLNKRLDDGRYWIWLPSIILDTLADHRGPRRGILGRHHAGGGGATMIKYLLIGAALFVLGVIVGLVWSVLCAFASQPAMGAELTCAPSTALRAHCWDAHGYLSTEERSGDYVHGHDNAGRSWTIWEHNGRSYILPERNK